MENSIIDIVIRIKNGYMARRSSVVSPHSKFKEKLVEKLVGMNYIKSYSVTGEIKKTMTVELLYQDGVPALTDVKIFSKPGRRYYVSHTNLKPVLSGFGHAVISTSKGIMTDKEARKQKIGGELLFSIW